MSGLIVYAAKVKKRDVLYKSSSGGIFTALSNICLKQGDAPCNPACGIRT